MTSASRKWVADPATSTTVRCHSGKRQNARGASAGSTGSSGVIPTIFTKPPAGIALRPYSVSPRRKEKTVGPKPAKYWVAFIPKPLAVSRWPASCRQTETRMPTAKMSTPIQKLMWGGPRSSARQLGGAVARPGLGLCKDVQTGERVPATVLVQHPGHRVDDARERQPTGEERLDAGLVGGVVDRRGGPAIGAGGPREPHRREGVVVERVELPGAGSCPVAPGRSLRDAVRPPERKRDRQPHVRRAGLR